MSFDDLPVILATNIYREARVSKDGGEAVVKRLAEASAIRPVKTPTGRTLLTIADGRRVYDAITKAA